MYKNLRLIPFLAFAILFAACERPVDLNLDEFKPQLVVLSNFVPDQYVEVQISATRSPLNNSEPEYIANAKVDLYLGQQLLETLTLIPGNNDAPPFYISKQVKPITGVTYTLRAEAPDFEPVEASSSIPTPTPISGLSISEVIAEPGTKPLHTRYSYNVTIFFDEPKEKGNYYHLNFYQQLYNYRLAGTDTIKTSYVLLKRKFSSLDDENTMISYFDGGVLFEDKKINGMPVKYTFPLDVELEKNRQLLGDVYAELRTVSKEYYLYYNSLSRQRTSAGGPFAEPVILYNNIENGQGIFAGYNPIFESIAIKR